MALYPTFRGVGSTAWLELHGFGAAEGAAVAEQMQLWELLRGTMANLYLFLYGEFSFDDVRRSGGLAPRVPPTPLPRRAGRRRPLLTASSSPESTQVRRSATPELSVTLLVLYTVMSAPILRLAP